MFKNSVHKDYSLIAIGNRRWAWLETPLLTALWVARRSMRMR